MNIELIERPRARRRDPATSHEAAKRADRFAKSHAGRILAVFQSCADFTYTADELARHTGLSVEQVCRRLPEIAEVEVVRENGQDRAEGGFRVWRLRSEPCYFFEAGEADRKAMR